MDYKKEIHEAEKKVRQLKSDYKKQQKILRKLKVGDVVYEAGAAGDHFEYYPQIILKIDIKNCRLFVHEKSIDKKEWIDSFIL